MLITSAELEDVLKKNEPLYKVFESCEKLIQQEYYVGAGCMAQSYWNFKHSFPLMNGIKDIDIVYFDPKSDDESERELNIRAKDWFRFASIPIEVVNQARVHEWYSKQFGICLNPYRSLEEALDSWPTTATCFGARMVDSKIKFYDQFGLKDLLALEVKPNKKLVDERIYLEKVGRWKKMWPQLKVYDWSGHPNAANN